jgi:septum formation protein
VHLILASASPRRAELLRAAGFDFDTLVTAIDETIRDGESPTGYVRRLAAEKSAAAQRMAAQKREGAQIPPRIFLAADTAVVVDSHILGKPADDVDAARMLRQLSGRRHDVLTGVSVRVNAYELGRVETTAVEFVTLNDDDIAWYVTSGEGRDKAGAYAIQGLASRFVPQIQGSYSNVVGLPIACVWELLKEISGTPRDHAVLRQIR